MFILFKFKLFDTMVLCFSLAWQSSSFKEVYENIRDLSLMVKSETFNLRHIGSNPIDLKLEDIASFIQIFFTKNFLDLN
jgi:hypothetical protein